MLAQAGADIILGSHPHVVQPYQILETVRKDGKKQKKGKFCFRVLPMEKMAQQQNDVLLSSKNYAFLKNYAKEIKDHINSMERKTVKDTVPNRP